MARRRLTPARIGFAPPHRAGEDAAPATDDTVQERFARETGAPKSPPPIARVAGEASGEAALRRVVEGMEEARASGRMVIDVALEDIAPGYLMRDRVTIDAQEIAVLKHSIRQHGQRVPAEITPVPHPDMEADADSAGDHRPHGDFRPWGLISGWRRLRALSELHAETGDMRFATLRALVRPSEEAAESYVAMVEENEIRVGISYYERARLVYETAAAGVFPDTQTALSTLFGTASRAKRSKIGSFIDIHTALGSDLRFPADIPERLGLAIVARLRDGGAARFHKALTETRPATAEAELALLTRLTAAASPGVSRAKQGPVREQLTPDLALATERRGDRLVLTLSGKPANDALLERVRQILRDGLT